MRNPTMLMHQALCLGVSAYQAHGGTPLTLRTSRLLEESVNELSIVE